MQQIVFDASKLTFKPYSCEQQLLWIEATMRSELAELYSRFTYNYFLTQFPHLTILAYYEGKIIGCVIGKTEKTKAYIAMIVVLKPYRRYKIGRKLFDQFFDIVVKQGVTKLELETECINTAALKFYEGLGFIRTRRMLNYYMSGNDAFRLKLYLPKKGLEAIQEKSEQSQVTQA